MSKANTMLFNWEKVHKNCISAASNQSTNTKPGITLPSSQKIYCRNITARTEQKVMVYKKHNVIFHFLGPAAHSHTVIWNYLPKVKYLFNPVHPMWGTCETTWHSVKKTSGRHIYYLTTAENIRYTSVYFSYSVGCAFGLIYPLKSTSCSLLHTDLHTEMMQG